MSEKTPALSEIYEKYHRKVVAYAAKLLGMDQAEDIAQEVFLKVGRSLGTLSDGAKLTSWIYAISGHGPDPPAPSACSPLRGAAARLPLLSERARRAHG